ncbi:hypothetical protein HK096_008043, partial [Nowakowskiella sp. JEL0078]
ITPVFDNIVNRAACLTISIGGREVEDYLVKLLKSDQQFLSQFSDDLGPIESELYDEILLEIARTVKESSACEIRDPSKTYPPDSDLAFFNWNGKKDDF